MNSNEYWIGIVAIVAIGGWLAFRLLQRWFSAPVSPDPWGPEVADALDQPDATAVCPHCQCPSERTRWFCPECGRAVGDYNNLNPYLYLFSMGEVLREGTTGRVRKSWLTIVGFVFLSLIEYTLLAPVYWFLLFRNLSRQRGPQPPVEGPPILPHT
jgi:hypothetical protein